MSRKPILFISYSHLDEPESPREGEVRRKKTRQFARVEISTRPSSRDQCDAR